MRDAPIPRSSRPRSGHHAFRPLAVVLAVAALLGWSTPARAQKDTPSAPVVGAKDAPSTSMSGSKDTPATPLGGTKDAPAGAVFGGKDSGGGASTGKTDGSSPAAASTASAPSCCGPDFDISLFAEYFPSAPTPAFDTSVQQTVYTQMSLLAGARVIIPIYRFTGTSMDAALPQILGLANFGYVAAGIEPGRGDDGLGLGFGVELRWQPPVVSPYLLPFARILFALPLAQTSDNPEGTLFHGSFRIAAGAEIGQIFDLHLLLGGTYSGGVALGVGFGIGYLAPVG